MRKHVDPFFFNLPQASLALLHDPMFVYIAIDSQAHPPPYFFNPLCITWLGVMFYAVRRNVGWVKKTKQQQRKVYGKRIKPRLNKLVGSLSNILGVYNHTTSFGFFPFIFSFYQWLFLSTRQIWTLFDRYSLYRCLFNAGSKRAWRDWEWDAACNGTFERYTRR